MSTERKAKKKSLEERINLCRETQDFFYEEGRRLQKELDAIESAEDAEDEKRWDLMLLKRQAI